MPDTCNLTVMAWLAGDTGRITGDLRDAIRRDLDELREGARLAGENIAVWAAYDGGCETLMLVDCNKGTEPEDSAWLRTNMADPENLMRFCDYAMDAAPASEYALIIGGHGSGPKKQDVYRGIVSQPVDLAFDDGSRKAMSIADLGMVCRHVAERGKLALVLLDACYMATVEVCEALSGSAEVLVASPEAVPGEGMPYAMLLQNWEQTVSDPGLSSEQKPVELGSAAVAAFALAYDSPAPDAPVASILAVDLKGVPDLLTQLDTLAVYAAEPKEADLQWSAGGQRASDPDFIYLASFCGRTSWYCRVTQPIIDSWASISAPDAGLVVYLPERGPLPRWYSELPIASRPFGQMVKRIVEG